MERDIATLNDNFDPGLHHDDDETAAHVVGLLREVYRSAVTITADIGRSSGLHPTDADALRLLDAASGRPTMSDLGGELHLSSAAVTALVDRLEVGGLARRVRDDHDRRRVRVELTETAHELAVEHLRPLFGRIAAAVEATPSDDLAVVERFLRLLVDGGKL
jgi:DNA-binding MarR family transcriptional regulator